MYAWCPGPIPPPPPRVPCRRRPCLTTRLCEHPAPTAGLYHTFADGGDSDNDGCTGTGDEVDDTPAVADDSNHQCSAQVDSCPNESSNLPDSLENYMDYVPDSCMDRFSPGQVFRMREQLKEHKPLGVGNWTAAASSSVVEQCSLSCADGWKSAASCTESTADCAICCERGWCFADGHTVARLLP